MAGKTPRDPLPPDPPGSRGKPRGDASKAGLTASQQFDARSGPKRGMSKADEPAGQPPRGGGGWNTEGASRARMLIL
jgi:hypothetical protein